MNKHISTQCFNADERPLLEQYTQALYQLDVVYDRLRGFTLRDLEKRISQIEQLLEQCLTHNILDDVAYKKRLDDINKTLSEVTQLKEKIDAVTKHPCSK